MDKFCGVDWFILMSYKFSSQIILIFIHVFGLWAASGCAQGLFLMLLLQMLLAELRTQYGLSSVEFGLFTYKTSALPSLLSLQPTNLFLQKSCKLCPTVQLEGAKRIAFSQYLVISRQEIGKRFFTNGYMTELVWAQVSLNNL